MPRSDKSIKSVNSPTELGLNKAYFCADKCTPRLRSKQSWRLMGHSHSQSWRKRVSPPCTTIRENRENAHGCLAQSRSLINSGNNEDYRDLMEWQGPPCPPSLWMWALALKGFSKPASWTWGHSARSRYQAMERRVQREEGSVPTLPSPSGCRQVPLRMETPRPGQAAMPL